MASVRWRGRRGEAMHSVHASSAEPIRRASAIAAALAFLPSFSCTDAHDQAPQDVHRVNPRRQMDASGQRNPKSCLHTIVVVAAVCRAHVPRVVQL